MRLIVAFLFVVLAGLASGDATERHPGATSAAPCLEQPTHPAPAEAVLRTPVGAAASSPIRLVALASAAATAAPHGVARPHLVQSIATASQAPQFRRFPLLI